MVIIVANVFQAHDCVTHVLVSHFAQTCLHLILVPLYSIFVVFTKINRFSSHSVLFKQVKQKLSLRLTYFRILRFNIKLSDIYFIKAERKSIILGLVLTKPFDHTAYKLTVFNAEDCTSSLVDRRSVVEVIGIVISDA
jgi:hypothetical protein